MSLPPEDQILLVRPLAIKEVRRQVLVPRRVIMARLMLYYLPRLKDVDRPWVSAFNALDRLRGKGRLESRRLEDTAWFYVPDTDPKALYAAEAEKVPLYAEWRRAEHRGAAHAEFLWRRAFADNHWEVSPSVHRVMCPIREDPDAPHTQQHEADVWATYRHAEPSLAVGCEVKNGLSEGWIDPDIVRGWRLTDAMRAIRHHFKAMAALGVTPMLVSPYVDRSFYRFQDSHGGLHSNCLYHVLSPDDADLAARLKDVFRLGHVWAEQGPPPAFVRFVSRIPALLAWPEPESEE